MTKKTKLTDHWNKCSPKFPCPICGHKKWCMVTKNGGVALCQHISQGSFKTAEKTGGWYHKLKSKEDNIFKLVRKASLGELAPKDVQEQATAIIESPNLLNVIVQEVQKSVVGEKDTIIAILINACGIWVINCESTSYKLITYSRSGSGKDYVVKRTLRLFPGESIQFRERISPKVFSYWHTEEIEPDWTWDGVIFYGEDVSDQVLNDEVFKLMASGKERRQTTIVFRGCANTLTINGNPVMFITTASANPEDEILRRFAFCQMNESATQSKRIKEWRSRLETKGTGLLEPDAYVKWSLQLLQRVKVKIPYAQELAGYLPNTLITRTVFPRFLDYIKASAALHQYQRKRDKAGIIIADPKDYYIACRVLVKTTSVGIAPLSGIDKDLWEIMHKYHPDREEDFFSTNFLASKCTSASPPTVDDHLNKLANRGLLEKGLDENRESPYGGRPSFLWRPIRQQEIKLGELIDTKLDRLFRRAKTLQKSH